MSAPLVSRGPAAVQLSGIEIRRRRRVILEGVEWTCRSGRIAWLVGENGAGKSSLLRVIAGRMRPSGGGVRWELRSGPDRRVLYYRPGMRPPTGPTAADWSALRTELPGPAVGADPLFPTPLDGDRSLGSLSTGETKRIMLATLLERAGSLVVLDEPYEHLSDAAKDRLSVILLRRCRTDVVVVATNQREPIERLGGDVLRVGERTARAESVRPPSPWGRP